MVRRTVNRTARIPHRLRTLGSPEISMQPETARRRLSIVLEPDGAPHWHLRLLQIGFPAHALQSTIAEGPGRRLHGTDSRMHLRWPRLTAGDPRGPVAENPEKSRADQGRRLRRLRHRSAYPERPLAEAIAVAVHARARDRRRAGRGRFGIFRRFHEQAA